MNTGFKDYVLYMFEDYLQRTENRNALPDEIAQIYRLNKEDTKRLLAIIKGEV